jgi:predicted lipid-binding transport protein (Tim44 family)
MLAQQSALNHETAYATLTLSLVGPKATVKQHVVVAKPPPGLTGGLAGGWHAFRLTISWLLTVLGAVAPFLAVIAVVGGLGWWSRRRLQQRRQPPPASPEAPDIA